MNRSVASEYTYNNQNILYGLVILGSLQYADA